MFSRFGKQVLFVLLQWFVGLSPAFAADAQVVSDWSHVSLDGLAPLSPQMTAILAYYAMQAGTGCPIFREEGDHAADDGHLHCNLTDALGLGYQCSPEHTGAVKKWFGKNLYALFDNSRAVRYAMKQDDMQWLCESTGDEASAHAGWTSLRVRTYGTRVVVDGQISSINRNDKVGIYSTIINAHGVYEIFPDRVEVLSRKNLLGH